MNADDRLRIIELMEQAHQASRNVQSETDRPTRARLLIEAARCNAQHREIRDRMYCEFAASRGWRTTERRFTVAPLITGRPRGGGGRRAFSFANARHEAEVAGEVHIESLIDHSECFRTPARPYAPVALLSHSYDTDQAHHLAAARRHGLAVEFLEWSWYYPERCLAALYVRQ